MDVDPVAMALIDPIAVLMPWLRSNLTFNEEIGDASHVSGSLRDPFPHIVLSQTAGGVPSDGYHADHPEIMIEAFAAPDGLPGKAELLRVLKVTTALLVAYPAEGIVSNRCAITNVTITSPYIFGPDLRSGTTASGQYTGGQIRWYTTIRVDAHMVSRR